MVNSKISHSPSDRCKADVMISGGLGEGVKGCTCSVPPMCCTDVYLAHQNINNAHDSSKETKPTSNFQENKCEIPLRLEILYRLERKTKHSNMEVS